MEQFVSGLHARPHSTEFDPALLAYEFDYGGKITAHVASLQAWPVTGVDLSVWQGDVDFSILASKAQFVVLRYAYGNTYVDPRLDQYYKGASDNKMAVMGYHYVKPDKSWDTHAKTMASLLANYPALFAWMDAEESGGLGKTALESWYYKYLYNGLAPRIGYRAGVYTSPGFWNANLPRTNWAKLHKIWNAHWTSLSQPILPYDWIDINNPRTWTLWQWSSKGPGKEYGVSSTYIDLNRYNGTAQQFNNEFSGAIVIPPPESGLRYRVLPAKLNVRSGPGTAYADIGDLFAGDVISVKNVGGTDSWIEFEPGKWACFQLSSRVYLKRIADLSFEVDTDVLNVRAGPGVAYADIGDLYRGTVIKAIGVGGANSWIEFEPGRWACVQLGKDSYMVRV